MIIDCIPFFDELDVLEIRLRELGDVVDRFVICEATRTFSDRPKSLYFDENRDRYAEFLDRIEHVVIDDFTAFDRDNTWSMDHGQKQFGVDWLLNHIQPSDGDLVLLTDCDEIPRAECVAAVAADPSIGMATPLMPIFYYWLNCRQMGPYERCAKWVRAGVLRGPEAMDLQGLRSQKNIGTPIEDGGWHFSYMGDIARKINSWAHSEYNRPPFNTPEHIARCKREGTDLFCRDMKYKFLEDLSYLPACVLEDGDRFGHLIGKA